MNHRRTLAVLAALLIIAGCSAPPETAKEPPQVSAGRKLVDNSSYQQAEEHFTALLDSARMQKDAVLEAICLKWLGNIQLAYRRKDAAMQYYNQSLALFDSTTALYERGKTPVPPLVPIEKKNVQNNIGNAYLDQGKYWEAEQMFSSVLEYDRSRNDPLPIAVSLYNLGLVEYRKTVTSVPSGDTAALRRGIAKAKDLFYQSLATFPTGDAYYNLGNLFAYTDQLDSAVVFMRKALDIYQSNGYRNQQSLTLGNIGVISYQQGNPQQASEALSRAIAIIEELRAGVASLDVRSSFVSNKYYLYEYMIASLMDLSRTEEAFEYVERAKARSFLDLIGNKAIGESKKRSPELRSLIDEESAMQERLARLVQIPDSSEVYLRLLARYKSVVAEIRRIDPEYTSVKSIEPLGVRALQKLLNDSTAVLEYFIGKQRSAIFLVTRDTLVCKPLNISQQTGLDKRIEQLRKKLYFEFPNKKIQFLREQRTVQKKSVEEAYALWYQSQADGSWQYDLLTMYSMLVKPIDQYLRNTRAVYIVPHGALHHLPFQSLIAAPGNIDKSKSVHVPRPRFWIEDMAISYLPSASVLQYAREKRDAESGSALVIGDPAYADRTYRKQPLDGALIEADSVASYLDSPEVLKREAAEESVVKKEIRGKEVVHFATHGELNKKDPMNSRILLAATNPEGENDGNLTVAEVFNLDLNASLVTLSACQTAQLASEEGSFVAGDDLVGLTRSFMYAGTPSVIASLWYVDDKATLDWMVHFYRGWREKGMTKIQAARFAAVEMLRNPSDPDWVVPYYWSAFIFLGDYEQ